MSGEKEEGVTAEGTGEGKRKDSNSKMRLNKYDGDGRDIAGHTEGGDEVKGFGYSLGGDRKE